ncbi:MAG TPA: exonuclease SbcCD subunit D [Gemmatimonadales bacterium]|nr:exonuclease SbcCD subunit D [Gemmatimonadales bacterium]
MKLAHLADLHLGFRQFDRQTPRGGNQREADVAEAFRRAVDDLLEQRPDLIVLAGDVFHSVRPTNPAILFFFQQLQRLRAGLPESPIVALAGNHDTPRSAETGTILRLYEALGVDVATDRPRRLTYSKLDCAVLAVPHQALAQPERPALRPEPGHTLNILVTHGQWPGLGETRGTMEYGGAPIQREDIAPAQWDYVALGHYHVAHEIEPNVWYSGSLEHVGPNPWGQMEDERERGRPGKGYLLVDLPGARVTFQPIVPVRRHIDLEPIRGAGLGPKQLDEEIARHVAAARSAIDDQIVRLLIWDVSRGTARDLDHAAIRGYKSRAFHFQLDVRRPEVHRDVGAGAPPPGRRQTLSETVREFLGRRPLDAELDRSVFVRLGVEYVEAAGAAAGEEPA